MSYPPQESFEGHNSKENEHGATAPMPPGYESHNIVAPLADENRFAPPSGPQDLWAAILFVVHLIGVIAIAVAHIPQKRFSLRVETSSDDASGGAAIAVGVLASILTSLAYLLIMRRFAKKLITSTLVICIITSLAAGIILMVCGVFRGAIMLIGAIIPIFCWRSYAKRIPFTSVMLETVTKVTMKFSSTVFVGFVGMIVTVAYSSLVLVTALSIFAEQRVSSSPFLELFELHKQYFGLLPVLVVLVRNNHFQASSARLIELSQLVLGLCPLIWSLLAVDAKACLPCHSNQLVVSNSN